MNCPRDNTPLRTRWGRGTFECPTRHHECVVSITDTGWNRNAIGAGAVQAVLDATTPRQEKHPTMRTNRYGATVLNQTERRALARHLAAQAIIDYAARLDWEDIPQLDREGVDALRAEITGFGNALFGTSKQYAAGRDVRKALQ